MEKRDLLIDLPLHQHFLYCICCRNNKFSFVNARSPPKTYSRSLVEKIVGSLFACRRESHTSPRSSVEKGFAHPVHANRSIGNRENHSYEIYEGLPESRINQYLNYVINWVRKQLSRHEEEPSVG